MSAFAMMQRRLAGARAAEEGFGLDANPHKPRTNYYHLWAQGHATVPQSKTPLNHTYQIGDLVRWRSASKREQQIGTGEEAFMVIEGIREVPEDEQVYNPNVEWRDSTGVGHHQHLYLQGRTGPPVSGKLVELVDEDGEEGPLADAVRESKGRSEPDDIGDDETPYEYNKRKYPDTVADIERLAGRSADPADSGMVSLGTILEAALRRQTKD